MGFLKFLGKFFGSFLIILSLTIIFAGLSVQHGLENLDVISKSTQENLPRILQENKELFLNSLTKDKINKATMKDTCTKNPDILPKNFCNRLGTMTEEEAVKEFADIMILKLQEEYKSELGEDFKLDIESQLKDAASLEYLKYATPLVILIFLLGSLLIFLAEKLNFMAALSHIGWKTGVVSSIITATNYVIKDITSEKVEKFIGKLPVLQGEQGGILAVKLISVAITDWIRIISTKIFYTSAIIAAASFLIVILLFVLKRKMLKKEEKPKGKLEKIVEEELKEEKNKRKKVSSKKKK